MSESHGRAAHLFEFAAAAISAAAEKAASYHTQRVAWWKAEQAKAQAVVEATASVSVRPVPVTGGERIDVVVNYGDPAAYARLQECCGKWQRHQAQADRYRVDAQLYGSQSAGRLYELTADDVAHFRLDGRVGDE